MKKLLGAVLALTLLLGGTVFAASEKSLPEQVRELAAQVADLQSLRVSYNDLKIQIAEATHLNRQLQDKVDTLQSRVNTLEELARPTIRVRVLIGDSLQPYAGAKLRLVNGTAGVDAVTNSDGFAHFRLPILFDAPMPWSYQVIGPNSQVQLLEFNIDTQKDYYVLRFR